MPDGALTVGDPEAMRDLARALVGRAELVAAASGGVIGKLGGAVFEGAAADRIRSAAADAQVQVVDAASRLRDIAADLLADADEVQRQNDALKAAAEKAEAAAAAEASAAGPAHDSGPAPAVTTTQVPSTSAEPAPAADVPDVSEGVTVQADPGDAT